MAEKENRFYTIGTWKGRPNYECKLCAFATLDRKQMAKHTEVHIKGNPELAGMEVPKELLPEVDETYGLTNEAVEAQAPTEKYTPPKKKGKGKEGKVKDG